MCKALCVVAGTLNIPIRDPKLSPTALCTIDFPDDGMLVAKPESAAADDVAEDDAAGSPSPVHAVIGPGVASLRDRDVPGRDVDVDEVGGGDADVPGGDVGTGDVDRGTAYGPEVEGKPYGPEVDVGATLAAIEANIRRVLEGNAEAVRLAVIALVAEGHLLVEDVPGVGKTLLAKSLGRSVDCSVSRIQFTPDLLPSDVTGVTVYSPDAGTFRFRPGPVFANIVLGDEINRAGPKVQSALLEAMQERTVTVDGTTHELTRPFMVIATQNPIELEGTYPLPEAQRDRFLMRISLGYPSESDEVAILRTHGSGEELAELEPVTDTDTVVAAIAAIRQIHVTASIERYIVAICRATRVHEDVELGASPRASLALLRASRAAAAMNGRDHVVPDDVKALAAHVLPHRLILHPEAEFAGRDPGQIIAEILARIPAPTE
ncbi:MAG: MoxR family ATPase [Nitriliruptoraceae bacterium]